MGVIKLQRIINEHSIAMNHQEEIVTLTLILFIKREQDQNEISFLIFEFVLGSNRESLGFSMS